MITRVYRATLFALYQLSIAVGILLMPLALVTQQAVGRPLPIHRVIESLETAYEGTTAE